MRENVLSGFLSRKSQDIAKVEDILSRELCLGLGGPENISQVNCCATRLRCTVHNMDLVDDARLNAAGGALGVFHRGSCVQVIYGPKALGIRDNLRRYLAGSQAEAGKE